MTSSTSSCPSSFKHSFMISLCFIIPAIILSCLPITRITGSFCGTFALHQALYPLIGIMGGSVIMSLWGIISLVFHWSWTAPVCKLLLSAHLASSIGMLYAAWISSSNHLFPKRAACALIPLACGIAFIIHPVGHLAPFYACYWLIPLIISCIPVPSLFFTALGSTFTCHAVGSVLWLYAGKITSPLIWNNLIPVVAHERLLFAFGTCIFGALIFYSYTFLTTRHTHKNRRQLIPSKTNLS